MHRRHGQASWWVALAWLIAGGIPAWAAEATLVADAHVNSALPAVNSGAISNLNVGAGYVALVQFDLGTLPVGTAASQISRAVLLLYCNRMDAAGTVLVQGVSSAWGEYSVTYATLPPLEGGAQVVTVGQAGAYVAVDVTAQVQGWLTTPASNHGLALTATTASVQFDSKENDQTGHAPTLDITLTTSGPAGPVGPIGPVGPVGSAGPQGATGPAGATGAAGIPGAMGPKGDPGATGLAGPAGVAGPVGPQGIAGPAGVQGSSGVAGPQGPAGPVGMNFQGPYSAAVSYGLGDGVLYGGAGYVSLAANNQGHVPDLSPGQWAEFASGGAGPAGPAGVAGPTGLMGPVGPIGPAGPAGAAGAAGVAGPVGATGLTYRGVYAGTTSYGLNNAVSYQGSSYISLAAGNQGHTPDVNPANWGVLAAQGAAGAVGARFRGAWGSGVPYAVSDAVSFGGSTYLAVAANSAEQPDLFPATWVVMAAKGDAGPAGPSGPSGAAATVSVGSVATGLAGSQAMITNSGTASAAVLNFTIPQGTAGTNGTGSGGSSSGSLPVSAYHAVSFSFTFYSLSGPTSSATETAPVLTWMPNACTATTLSVYSQQGNPILVKLRQGLPGAMVDTGLTCSVVAAGTCSVTGSVPVAAGSFVDLSVTGADGSPAAVWTSLGCS